MEKEFKPLIINNNSNYHKGEKVDLLIANF